MDIHTATCTPLLARDILEPFEEPPLLLFETFRKNLRMTTPLQVLQVLARRTRAPYRAAKSSVKFPPGWLS